MEDFVVPQGEMAVLVNANAGRARRAVLATLRREAPQAAVYWTRSLEEADDAIEAVLESEVEVLFAGGGDGTIMDLVARLLPYKHAPKLGILKLGTGNALASWVGARRIDEDLRAWALREPYRVRAMRLLRADGEPFAFAGMGWDAAVLNDYRWMKQRLEQTPLRGKAHHLWVYLASAFGRTVPRYATGRPPPNIVIEVADGEAWRVDRRGSPIGPRLRRGEVLYSGPANVTAFGSTPFYGYQLRMFPHAEALPTHFQLRVVALGIPTVINELPRLWMGELDHEKLHDFVVQSVRVSCDQDVPYQVCGDARGMRRELSVRLDPRTVPVVSFS